MENEVQESLKKLVDIIQTSKDNTYRKINEELIIMYWNIGEFLSVKAQESSFGDAYIDSVANFIQNEFPGIKGFNRRGLYRMKQFYEIYRDDEFVSALLTQISWTSHLLIMSKAKTSEERQFYLMLCIKEHYSSRELERQMNSAYFERYMLSRDKILPEESDKIGDNIFLDSYILEFLSLPNNYKEKDLRKALISNMKDFILEIGRDFSFVGEEYRIQVGSRDFFVDLLFYHRGISCLVAFELKIGQFEPEFVSKMDFYLEALDRQYKKENENPSVGIILCAGKDDEVVEYAMSRSMSPTMVAEYQLKLPDKKILQKKLKELSMIESIEEDV